MAAIEREQASDQYYDRRPLSDAVDRERARKLVSLLASLPVGQWQGVSCCERTFYICSGLESINNISPAAIFAPPVCVPGFAVLLAPISRGTLLRSGRFTVFSASPTTKTEQTQRWSSAKNPPRRELRVAQGNSSSNRPCRGGSPPGAG